MRRQVAYVEKAFQTCNSYGSGWKFHIAKELYFIFVFLKRNTPDIKHHVGEDHSNSFLPYHNPQQPRFEICFLLPQVSSLRFEQIATKPKTQAQHEVVTRHMKGTNRATIHHLNKEKLHMLTTHTRKQVIFLGFSKFCPFLFDFSYANFYGFSEFCKFLFGFMQGFESGKDRV